MAKKALLKDHDNIEILPITRGELVLDSSGKVALHSNEFLASNSRPGLMSAEDKAALNSLAGGTIDSDLSTTSTNPVQNKVVTNAINSIKTSYLKSATVSTNTLTIVDQSNKETKFYNTTYGVVTQAADGLAPKLGTDASATIGTQADEWVLTSTKGSAPTWRKLPVNAFKNDNNNTTYTFASGNGGFTVTPSGGTAQFVSIGYIDGQYINKLTGYTKATTIAALAATDTLNTALGKLELKADTTYDLVRGAYDGDGTIENLAEILKVLEGISDTETIQAIVGKYLPLSGGTLNGPLGISSSTQPTGNMGFWSGANIGFIMAKESLQFYKSNTKEYYDILHSGNIYEKNLGLNEFSAFRFFTVSGDSLAPKNESIISGFTVAIDGNNFFKKQLAFGHDLQPRLYVRSQDTGSWSDWKTIAFTDSNVASAQALVHSNGTKGAEVNESGVLVASKNILINNATSILAKSTSSTNLSILTIDSSDTLLIGYGMNGVGGTTIFGNGVAMRYGASRTMGFLLNSSGNVTIGASDLAGTGAKLYVDGSVKMRFAEGKEVVFEQYAGGYTGACGLSFYANASFIQGSITASTLLLNPKYGGNVGIGTTSPAYKLDVVGDARATSFVKLNSSNSYLLLGGGGHKAISDFMLKSDELTNNLTTITKTLTVTKDWMDTGIKSTDLSKGTYIIQVSVAGNDSTARMWDCIWSGIMSWDPQVTNDDEPDEIILHRAGHAYANTIYIRTLMTPRDTSGVGLKLQIAANKNIGAAYTYTFKFKRVI